MQISFERKYNIVKGNGFQASIPEDQSVISILSKNEILEEDEFRSDYFVYRNGIRHRKWFSNLGSNNQFRIWMPKIKDIALLERKRVDLLSKCRAKYLKPWKEFIFLMKENKLTHIYCDTEKPLSPGIIKISMDEEERISWNWVEGDSESLVKHNEIGAKYFEYERAVRKYSRFIQVFEAAFFQAIEHKIYSEAELKLVYHFIINGRHYWFERTKTGLKKIFYPEDQHEEIIEETL